MPYTKSDYPNTMKNLDQIVRVKAIDILNAMLKEGYDEENAIPISISQAKEWKEKASQKEKDQLFDKDITAHDKKSDTSRLQDADVKVSYDSETEKWVVKSIGAKQADSSHKLKKNAVERAKEIAENKDSNVIKMSKDE